MWITIAPFVTVTGGTKGMTNQSGNDDKQLADQRSQQKDERECRQHRGQG
ncbi:hypothetical protein [Escherichia coli]|nr:hypothetical protein [Escherichia coli]